MIQKIREALIRRHDQEGATAVEYGLMVALIAVVIIVAVVALGNNVSETFQCTADSLGANDDLCADPGTTSP